MVFSNLSSSEKDAFFGLLDEYFASRPDVFGSAPSSSASGNHAAVANVAASALHSAFTNQASASEENATEPAWKRKMGSLTSSPQPPSSDISNSVGRVAAAAAAFKLNPAAPTPGPPRPPPRRNTSYGSSEPDNDPPPASSSQAHSRALSSAASKLVPQKKFGDVDMSSGKNMYLSIRHGTTNKTAAPPSVAPPAPAAFAQPKNNFGPPPVRRVSSATPETQASPPPPPPRARQPEPEPEPEEPGEWAEALYDYSGTDADDLDLHEGQRIWIVERTSDDWWTAVHEGKRGLIPAAYVKVL